MSTYPFGLVLVLISGLVAVWIVSALVNGAEKPVAGPKVTIDVQKMTTKAKSLPEEKPNMH